MKKIKNYLILSTFLVPAVSFAALNGLRGLLDSSVDLLNLGIRVLFALAIVLFFWGLAQFILKAGDAKTREDGKKRMVWGIIAIFVMASIYGILAFVGNTLGIDTGINQSGAPNYYGCDPTNELAPCP